MDTLSLDIGGLAIRATPVIAGAVTEAVSTYLGLTLHEWFYITVILYTMAQIWALIYTTLKDTGKKEEEVQDE